MPHHSQQNLLGEIFRILTMGPAAEKNEQWFAEAPIDVFDGCCWAVICGRTNQFTSLSLKAAPDTRTSPDIFCFLTGTRQVLLAVRLNFR